MPRKRTSRGPRRRFAALAVLLASASLAGGANVRRPVTLDVVDRDPPLGSLDWKEVRWVPRSHRVSYLAAAAPGSSGLLDLWIEDASTGEKTKILTGGLLRAGDAKASGDSPGPLAGYRWSPDGTRVLFSADRNLWLASPGASSAVALTRGPEAKEFPRFSPDGARVAYVQDHDLYCVEIGTGESRRLTTDGAAHVLNGRLDWVYEEELASRSGQSYAWSPDSRLVASLKLDESRVPSYPMVDYLPAQAGLEAQRYPRPGQPNSVPAVVVIGVDGRVRARVDFSSEDVYVLPDLTWTPDSLSVGYAVMNREQTRLDYRLLDLHSGKSRTLFTESDRYWLNVSNFSAGPPLFVLPRFLEDGSHFLWISERSGFAHLYRGDLATGRLDPLTSGPWMVDAISGIDESSRYVYFLSTREDARRREIDRIHLDGSGFERISLEPGTHRAAFSPDGMLFLDTFSTVSEPPSLRLRRADGSLVRVLAGPSRDAQDYALGRTEWVDLRASDGTPLHARLVKPRDFDPSRRYPVVVDVYGGPDVQSVRDIWGATTPFDHLLVGSGYLVWELDNRGSSGRGHAFETPIFEELGKTELDDQLAGVRYLKTLPYVDAARLALTGWSYGGYMTLYAATRSPETWKCAIAGAPVTDWRLYDSVYTERYMRTPEANPGGYERSALPPAAARIRAKLLLIHGTADDNVHFQNTIRIIDGLTEANVDYELQIQPGQRHSIRGEAARHYRDRRVLEFLKENL